MGILEKYIIESNQSRSTVALFPLQLRQVKSHLLNSNNLDDLMLWTLLIVCIKQFLQICEGISLTTESFVTDLATKSNYKVNSLTTRIRGKTDVNEIYLQLWDDEECPEFSPVIALLIYSALSGIQDGFIFPNTQNASLHVKYQTVLYKIKKLTSELLKLNVNRDDENGFIVGTHLARKTGLLLASWSFLSYSRRKPCEMVEEPLMDAMLSNDSRSTYNFGDVRSDMRHNSTASTKTYLADAATMFELVKSSSRDPKDTKVGVYRGILVKNPEVLRKVLGKKIK